MPTRTEVNNIIDANRPSIQVVLAESNPFEVDRIRSSVGREFQAGIRVASSYDDLIAKITAELPQLVLLGRIDRFNYFDICKDCHEIREKLPIFLISREETISDSFLKLAKTRGLTDIIEPDPVKLNLLFQTVSKSIDQIHSIEPSESLVELPIVGIKMLEWLEEIITISNNYFGPLAQGNYWRKAHAKNVGEFPSIANWSVDHFSKVSCSEIILIQPLTDNDIQGLYSWVKTFIEECERIITDYRSILNNSNLSLLAKDLLIKS
jgi:hypothetical protein